jgi:hypothetical protein
MGKASLIGKSSNNIQRATRPGVVQITTHSDDNGSIASIATASRTSLVEEEEHNPVSTLGDEQPETTPSDDANNNNNSVSQDQGQDALTITGDEVGEADDDDDDDDDENSHNQQLQQNHHRQQQQEGAPIPDEEIREREAEADVAIPEEDLVLDAQVELVVGDAAEHHDNDDNNVASSQQQQEVMSIQLTQSSFPIAQPVNISYEEEEEEGQETDDTQDGGGDDLSLHESIHSSCHSIMIMQEQQVVVATTTNDVERHQDHHRPLQQQQQQQSEEILSSSNLTDGNDENKFRMFPRRRSRRIMCCVAIGVLVIVASVIGTILSVKKSGANTYADTNEWNDKINDLGGSKDISINDNVDTNFVEVLLKSFLESMGTNEHKIPGTPQYKALQWLNESAREDSEEFNLTEWTIRDLLAQRYVLAVFYFATGGDGESNDNSSGGWDDDCGFLSAKSECEWKCSTKSNKDGIDLGIICDESSRIQKILLPSNNLSGMIAKEFQSLTFLTELDMSNNNIVGQLPNDVGDLKNLKSFNVAHNRLTGSLPPSIGNLSFLRELNLMNNNLDGVVPLTVARLRSLEVLLLNGNNFAGGLDNFCTYQSRSVLRHRQLRSRLSSFFSDCSYSADYKCDCCRIAVSVACLYPLVKSMKMFE